MALILIRCWGLPVKPHDHALTATPHTRQFKASITKLGRRFWRRCPAMRRGKWRGVSTSGIRFWPGKQPVEEVYNEGKDALYQWQRVGEVAQTTAMPKVHPDVLRSGDAPTIQAAEALVKALTVPDWGKRTFKTGKMTQRTLDEFAPYRNVAEIQDLLASIQRGDPVDGLLLKRAKRRYPEKEAAIQTPDDLNQWFEQVLRDPNATLHQPAAQPKSRYTIHSATAGLLAVVDRSGQRVSVYQHDGTQLEAVWQTLNSLIQIKTP